MISINTNYGSIAQIETAQPNHRAIAGLMDRVTEGSKIAQENIEDSCEELQSNAEICEQTDKAQSIQNSYKKLKMADTLIANAANTMNSIMNITIHGEDKTVSGDAGKVIQLKTEELSSRMQEMVGNASVISYEGIPDKIEPDEESDNMSMDKLQKQIKNKLGEIEGIAERGSGVLNSGNIQHAMETAKASMFNNPANCVSTGCNNMNYSIVSTMIE